jgi:hypothetical protein
VLAKAEREGTLREKIRFLCRFALLIVDEIGYLPVTPGGGNLLFQLVNACYEKGAIAAAQEVESTAHAAQHAEAQHVDLHEFQRVDIVLVPFDDLTVVHGGGLDRNQLIEPVECQHEASRVLRKMARRADQLSREIKRHTQTPVA